MPSRGLNRAGKRGGKLRPTNDGTTGWRVWPSTTFGIMRRKIAFRPGEGEPARASVLPSSAYCPRFGAQTIGQYPAFGGVAAVTRTRGSRCPHPSPLCSVCRSATRKASHCRCRLRPLCCPCRTRSTGALGDPGGRLTGTPARWSPPTLQLPGAPVAFRTHRHPAPGQMPGSSSRPSTSRRARFVIRCRKAASCETTTIA